MKSTTDRKLLRSSIAVLCAYVLTSIATYFALVAAAAHLAISGTWALLVAQHFLTGIAVLTLYWMRIRSTSYSESKGFAWGYVAAHTAMFALYRFGTYPDKTAMPISILEVFRPWYKVNSLVVLVAAAGTCMLLFAWRSSLAVTLPRHKFLYALTLTLGLTLFLYTLNAVLSYPRTLPLVKSVQVHEQLSEQTGILMLMSPKVDAPVTIELKMYSDEIVMRESGALRLLSLPEFDQGSYFIAARVARDAAFFLTASRFDPYMIRIHTLPSDAEAPVVQYLSLPYRHEIVNFAINRMSSTGRGIYLESGRFLYLEGVAGTERFVYMNPDLRFAGWSGDLALLFDLDANELVTLDVASSEEGRYPLSILPDENLVAALSHAGDCIAYSVEDGSAIVVQSLEANGGYSWLPAAIGNLQEPEDGLSRGHLQSRLDFVDKDVLVYLSMEYGLASVDLQERRRIFHSPQGATVFAWAFDASSSTLHWLEYDLSYRLVSGELHRMRQCAFPGVF